MGMLASTLRRNVGDGTFENLQQSLLHALAGNITGDGRIFVFTPDLIDFINVDDAGLGAAHVSIRRLQQFQNNVLDVFADITGFGERGGVDNGKRHIEHASQSLRQQSLAGSGGADQHDVRLREFDAVAGFLPVHEDALVMIVDRDRQLFLGLLLPNYVFIKERFYFLRLGQLVGSAAGRSGRAVVFQNGIAHRHALVANVRPRVITGRRDQFGYRVLRFVAERTAKNLVGPGFGFHSALLLWRPRG